MAAPTPASDHTRAALATLAFVAVGLALAYLVSERVAPVYPEIREREALLDVAAPDVEAVSLGNSHARAIDFETLGVRGFDLALGGADLFETLHLFRHARRRLPALREVYLPIEPMQIDNGVLPERQARRRAIYLQTGDYRPMSGDWRLALTSPLTPLIRDDHWAAVFRHRRARSQFAADGRLIREPRQMSPAEVEADGLERAAHHRLLARQSEAASPALCADLAEALRELAVASLDLRFVLYTPPYPRAYYEALVAPPARCDLRPLAADLARAHPHVLYVDGSRSALADDPTFFLNGDHVNDAGALAFSARLRAAMHEAGFRAKASEESHAITR